MRAGEPILKLYDVTHGPRTAILKILAPKEKERPSARRNRILRFRLVSRKKSIVLIVQQPRAEATRVQDNRARARARERETQRDAYLGRKDNHRPSVDAGDSSAVLPQTESPNLAGVTFADARERNGAHGYSASSSPTHPPTHPSTHVRSSVHAVQA